MREHVMLGSGRRGEELRYVTQHFDDLQGLRLAPLLLYLMSLPLIKSAHFSSRANDLVMVGGVAVFLASFFGMNRWFQSRYGFVVRPAAAFTKRSPWRTRLFLLLYLVAAGLAITGFILRPQAPGAWGAVVPAWVLLSPRCFEPVPASGVLVTRRVLYAAALLVVLTVSIWDWFGHPVKWMTLQSLVVSLLVLALYDHWLLDTVLRGGWHGREAASE